MNYVGTQEEPPAKIMQTVMVNERGYLTNELALMNYLRNAWTFVYLADVRKFKWEIIECPAFNGVTIDPVEDAQGNCRVYGLGH